MGGNQPIAIRTLIKELHKHGHEIGLHPSYNTFQQPELILKEFLRLKKICSEEGVRQNKWGGRMHYLRWNTPVTMLAWEQAGLNYDSSLGYADKPGFRCGTSYEYPAFDSLSGKILNLRIRPLVVMECTILEEHYLGMSGKEALKKFVELRDVCKIVNGSFTLLWHNSRLVSDEDRALYQAVLNV